MMFNSLLSTITGGVFNSFNTVMVC
ncbi:hypothetical protein [African swine fever virus]